MPLLIKPTQFHELLLTDLVPSDANPIKRTVNDARMKELIESVKQHGVIVPIAVTMDGHILDGHRRLYAAREAGHVKIAVIVVDKNSVDIPELIVDVITTNKPVTTAQKLETYVKTKTYPKGPTGKQIKELEKLMGFSWLEKRAEKFGSPDILNAAKVVLSRIADSVKACDHKDPKTVKKTIEWMEKHGCQNDAKFLSNASGDNRNATNKRRKALWNDINKDQKPAR